MTKARIKEWAVNAWEGNQDCQKRAISGSRLLAVTLQEEDAQFRRRQVMGRP
jgi:hypothetical protein